jgi:large subunit ribosomal protein L9
MKVILQRDVPKVGKGGEIVNVSDGYARNYLFPRKYAVPAAGGFLKEHQSRADHDKVREARLHQVAEQAASKLGGLSVIITGKVGAGTKLYGSITAQDVADGIMKATGLEVDKRRIGLVDPIKSLGVYPIAVRLASDVVVTVNVDVTTDQELERRAREAEQAAAQAAAAAAAAAEAPEAAD